MCNRNCKNCNCLIKSTAVAVVGGNLQVTIPTTAFSNLDSYCLVICQSIPCVGLGLPVVVLNGATKINIEDKIGNYVIGAQVKTRCKYKLIYGGNPIHLYSNIMPKKCYTPVVAEVIV